MYKYASKQIRFEDFGQPIGMTMSPEDRWVKRAESIPWNEIEKRYAALFKNRKGNVAKPLRLALGACIIQAEYGYSDEETALQIQEGPYLQFFCGFPKYEYKCPFDPSLMVYFRKRLTPEILGEINELIIQKAEEKVKDGSEDKPEPPTGGNAEETRQTRNPDSTEHSKNCGTLIVDATCAPSNIKYPQDTELLNEARENTEAMIDELHDPKEGKRPRTYRKTAHKNYLKFARSKNRTGKLIRKSVRQQLGYLKSNLGVIDRMLSEGNILSEKYEKRLETIRTLYEQQKFMYDNKVHSVKERIVSLSQPYLRPIVRGKIKAPVEFGTKLDISVVGGYARLEKQSFDPYNESGSLQEEIERYKVREGCYPKRVLADKIYRNRKNLNYCKERGIRLSDPALGRPKKGAGTDKKLEYSDICERVEVERKFSLAKRKCGLGLIMTKLRITTEHVVAMSILLLNLRKVLCAFLRFILDWLFLTLSHKNRPLFS